MSRFTLLLSPLWRDLRNEKLGWATESLLRSVHSTVLSMVAIWQAVMVLATFFTIGWSGWLLAAAHAALGTFMIVLWKKPHATLQATVPLFMGVLALISISVSGDIDSVLVFAACWLLNSSAVVAGLIVLSRWTVAFVVLGSSAAAVFTYQSFPQWGVDLPLAIVVTMPSIVLCCRYGLLILFRLASDAESQSAIAEDAARRAMNRRRVSRQIAEDARVLHDTAINTLAVIANSGTRLSDVHEIREHCRRDTDILRVLRSERSRQNLAGGNLKGIFEWPSLPVRRSGLDDRELDALADDLDEDLTDGLVRAASEVLTNARKHSRGSHVSVHISRNEDSITIDMSDDGIGFDGQAPHGHGLASSVLARARDLGFTAKVDSAPGQGTRVTLTAPLRKRPTKPEPPIRQPLHQPAEVVASLHRQAGLLWCLGVTAVSVVLTLIGGTNQFGALYGMFLLLAIVCTVGLTFKAPPVKPALAVFYIVSTGATFLLSAAAISFGSEGAVHWQSLASTGPFILLLSYRPKRSIQALGTVVWVIVIALTATLAVSANAAQIVAIGGFVGLLFSRGWTQFLQSLSDMTEESARAHERAFYDHITLVSEQATQESYRRWLDAGLDSALTLLHEIADGTRDPLAPDTQTACGAEELYLRQLVLISPEIVHLGNAAIPLLRHAREQEIPFRLRLGGLDTPNESTAAAVAGMILHALTKAENLQPVSASVFPWHSGLQLTLTGPFLDRDDFPELPLEATVETNNNGSIGVTQVVFEFDSDVPRNQVEHSVIA